MDKIQEITLYQLFNVIMFSKKILSILTVDFDSDKITLGDFAHKFVRLSDHKLERESLAEMGDIYYE